MVVGHRPVQPTGGIGAIGERGRGGEGERGRERVPPIGALYVSNSTTNMISICFIMLIKKLKSIGKQMGSIKAADPDARLDRASTISCADASQ